MKQLNDTGYTIIVILAALLIASIFMVPILPEYIIDYINSKYWVLMGGFTVVSLAAIVMMVVGKRR